MHSRMETHRARTAKGVLIMGLGFALIILLFGGVADGGKKSSGSSSKIPANENDGAGKSGGGSFIGQLGKDVGHKVARDTISKWIEENIPYPVLLGLVLVGLLAYGAYYIGKKYCCKAHQNETGSDDELTNVVAAGDGANNGVSGPPITTQCDASDIILIPARDNDDIDNNNEKTTISTSV